MEKKDFYKWNSNKDKMILNTPFKKFNNQTNYIGSGNVVSNTQYSNHIRPCKKIECNGIISNDNELFNFDTIFFNIPLRLKKYIQELNTEITLYEFFVSDKKSKDILGWLVDNHGEITIHQNFKSRKDNSKRLQTLEYLREMIKSDI